MNGYQMVNSKIISLALILLINPIWSLSAAGQTLSHEQCVHHAQRKPFAAADFAKKWLASGGGVQAEHCLAIALLNQGETRDAATRLEALPERIKGNGPQAHNMRINATLQAAHAWLSTGEAERADKLFSKGLFNRPKDPEIWIDRAVARVQLKRYWDAVDDFGEALDLDPNSVDALTYRAVTYRYLEILDLARDDIEKAVSIAPLNPGVLLERGLLSHLEGKAEQARQDWETVIKVAPGTPQAKSAVAFLKELLK